MLPGLFSSWVEPGLFYLWWEGFSFLWLLLLRGTGSKGVRRLQYLWLTGLTVRRHMGSSRIQDGSHVSCLGRWILYDWVTRETKEAIYLHIFYIVMHHRSNDTFIKTFFFLSICNTLPFLLGLMWRQSISELTWPDKYREKERREQLILYLNFFKNNIVNI